MTAMTVDVETHLHTH